MTNNNSFSASIDTLRVVCAVFVVMLHTIGGQLPASFSSLSPVDGLLLLRHLFRGPGALLHAAVPTFFLLSGLLFFRRLEVWDSSVYRSKLLSRFRSLLVPYLLWNVLFFIFSLPQWLQSGECSSVLDAFTSCGGLRLFWDSSVSDVARLSWFGTPAPHFNTPLLGPLWFIRDLMVLVLLAPVILFALRRLGIYFLFLVAFAHFSGLWPDVHGLCSSALFYFSLGAWFTVSRRPVFESFYRFRWLFWSLAPLLMFSVPVFHASLPYGVEELSVFFCVSSLLCLVFYFVDSRGFSPAAFFVRSTFFVYVSHLFVKQSVSVKNYFLEYPFVVLAVSLLLYYCLESLFPRVTSFLCGSRSSSSSSPSSPSPSPRSA
ncbi:MAG: acyltransferase family protein [Bacteroidales bacterium]|nr:acyltransferase family protein [Bacteroidales bacterium]